MKKWVCTVCGYVYEGENAPEFCPVCKAPASKFKEQSGDKTWAAEHVVGVAQGACREYMMQLDKNSGEIGILLDIETKKTVRLKELVPNWWGYDRFRE